MSAPACGQAKSAEPQEAREHVADERGLRSCRRRRARHEVDHATVLHAVIGDAVHLLVLVEIDREDSLVGDLRLLEGDRALRLLADVVPASPPIVEVVDGVPITTRTCSADAPTRT